MTRPALPASLLHLPVSHRALHDRAAGRIENSPAAIKAAVAAGYAIEVDVHLSADGRAMVFHDDDLDRLTAHHGPVSAQSADALGRIVLTGGSDTIPTLPEVLTLVAGRVPLLIEIKDQTGVMGQTDGRLETAVAQALAGYGGDVAVMSFNPHSMAHMARLSPHVARGLTTSSYDPEDWSPVPAAVCDHLRGIPDFDRVGASFISHQANDLTRPRVLELRDASVPVLCWTIRSPEQEAMARQIAANVTFEGYLSAIPA
ncbi:MAG: glycerophosphodiester phosphodiesterase family protein [Pseudotabrizicola sp.]|uniref:glycerophosphodiester phosphodiesterase family protein n=1 Tax=Pseudotabrizicola sp. TaxID=2939647 RepID=UPI002721889D|nr:glycerophosphodiester phosphodiesterase family protein [Pseudotabrizicola sp.]MDO8882449.1 glycerophosphodiester phosphodiesterase family protein [Pseudotabrizicola sp.]MDP2082285.1 glycerophosphodiester phosphodiesterase family protein [Pseudotabrizicola sp.]MDZ7575205.1 glycerophosphodiester phosphodiesterase family protein [Pseudotabrizicola sp.]